VDVTTALRRQRDDALGVIAALTAEHADIVAAAELTSTDDEHDPEGSTIAFERARIAALVDQTRRRLAEIDDALRRAELGDYGSCQSCGAPIDAARLAARPSTDRCIDCAARSR
jgi:RNA polymerase-binding transcription factor DksA